MRNTIKYAVSLLLALAMPLSALAVENEHTWPAVIQKNDATITIYQPQLESLTANKMEARAAVSVTNKEYTSPVFGAVWFDCKVSTDRDKRLVYLNDVDVSAAKFPDVEEEKIEALKKLLEQEMPKWKLKLSLDQLLTDLEDSEVNMRLSDGLNNTPPEIIFKSTPHMLISIDGEPIFQEIDGSNYERVVNTPFFIVKDTKKDDYYIKGGDHWYLSENLDKWEVIKKAPNKLEKIAQEAMGEDKESKNEHLTARDPDDVKASKDSEDDKDEVVPQIIVRTKPAELLQADGEPAYEPIEGSTLLFMTNTADDILMDIESQEYYTVISGRWYRTGMLAEGPWFYVEPEDVPEVFAEIPTSSEMASIRSSVAGTEEAREAILESQIPQTAEVDRNEAKLEVSYDGDPKFEQIGDTEMRYALNTDKSVLFVEDMFYCCDNAIWFEADYPEGPWTVSTAIPDDIQNIPPESPVYNVKYVYIYDSTPEVVYVGYTPGYTHSYIYRGCVYYGTGYHYRPWYGRRYYPRPVTYGYNVHWNPYTGWGFSFSYSWGWMAHGWGAPYGGWWGPTGYRYGYHYGYHHGYRAGYRAGYYAGRNNAYRRPSTPYASRPRPTNNVYNNRSQGVRRTGDNYYDPKTGSRVPSQGRDSRPSTAATGRPNNVYTDRDGNVYKRDNGDWNSMDNRPSTREGDRGSSSGSTRPSTSESTRPSTGQETRPSTGQSTRPSTGQETRPSTGQSTRPSTGQSTRPSTGQSTRPSTSQSPQPSTSQNRSSGSLNQDYNSRSRGQTRTQNYNSSRPSYQNNRSAGSSGGASRSTPQRSTSRSSAGSRR